MILLAITSRCFCPKLSRTSRCASRQLCRSFTYSPGVVSLNGLSALGISGHVLAAIADCGHVERDAATAKTVLSDDRRRQFVPRTLSNGWDQFDRRISGCTASGLSALHRLVFHVVGPESARTQVTYVRSSCISAAVAIRKVLYPPRRPLESLSPQPPPSARSCQCAAANCHFYLPALVDFEMILDKKPLPDDPTPSEPPPSYEELQRVAASLTQHRDTKDLGRFSPTSPSASSSSISPCLPLTAKRSTSKGKSRWFPFGQAARTAQEVKHTVLALVRDVVRVPEPSAAISILKNCAEACVTHDLSFSAVLQEKSVEGHTPIYWAIVKRPAEPVRPTDPDLVTVLLSLAAPLSEATLSEIRLACLQTSDQVLFQRLRRVPAFSPLSGADEILLGASIPPDEIEVEDIPGDQGAFKVQFRILLFQKRMRVTKSINLEFIARGTQDVRS